MMFCSQDHEASHSIVMPALVAGIHFLLPSFSKQGVDGRDKPAMTPKRWLNLTGIRS